MTNIPAEFQRLVQNIEQGQQGYVKVVFSTVKELQQCATYFYNRAAQQPEISRRFADEACRLYFLAPTNEESDINLRKALIYTAQKQIEFVDASINNASNIGLERAIGIVKFFGELYNVGFIFKGILKKHVDIFHATKNECFISNRCFYCLIETVKSKVKIMAESDYSVTIKSLSDMIDKEEENPTIMEKPIEAKKSENPKPVMKKTFEEQFPALSTSPPRTTMDTSFASSVWQDKTTIFKRLLDELTQQNAMEILKKIEGLHQHGLDGGAWQVYCDLLIEKALTRHELAETIIDICQKLPRCQAWQSVKNEEYKKYIHHLINVKLGKVFDTNDGNDRKNQLISILIVTQKLIEHSLSSIGDIAAFIDVLLNRAKNSITSNVLASQILLQVLMIIKRKINANKIKKLPEEVRKNVLQVITSGQNGRLTDKIKSKIKEIAEYIDMEYVEEDEGVSISNGHDDELFSIDDKKSGSGGSSGVLSPQVSSPSSTASPFDYLLTNQLPFDYSSFIDELAITDKEKIKNSIQTASTNRDWDLTKLAEKLFEKSLRDCQHATYVGLSILINDGARAYGAKTFEDALTTVALRAFGRELSFDSVVQLDYEDVSATSTAEFLSELYKIGWLSNPNFFQCMEKVANNEFETVRRIKILHALLKPSAIKLMKGSRDDRFYFYKQKIRARVNTVTDTKDHLVCVDLLKLLEDITSTDNNSNASSQVMPKDNKFEQINTIVNSIDFNNMKDCLDKIVALGIKDGEELSILVDVIITKAMTEPMHIVDFAKLTCKLDGFKFPENCKISFKLLLTSRCQNKLVECANKKIDPHHVSGTYLLVQFISELFKMGMYEVKCIYLNLEMFFRNEINCLNIVYCINIMMRAIGQLIEKLNPPLIDYYFNYFEFIVINSQVKSYRSLVYSKLIELRQNKWILPALAAANGVEKNPEMKLATVVDKDEEEIRELEQEAQRAHSRSLVINLESFEENNSESIVADLRKHLTTKDRVKMLIKAMLKKSFTGFKIIKNCATLLRKLDSLVITVEHEQTFKNILMEMLYLEFIVSNSKRNLNEAEMSCLTNLIFIVGELYLQGVLNENEIYTWLLHKHLSNISVEYLASLSFMIAPKIQANGDKRLGTILNMLETNIDDGIRSMHIEINSEIVELQSALNERKNRID